VELHHPEASAHHSRAGSDPHVDHGGNRTPVFHGRLKFPVLHSRDCFLIESGIKRFHDRDVLRDTLRVYDQPKQNCAFKLCLPGSFGVIGDDENPLVLAFSCWPFFGLGTLLGKCVMVVVVGKCGITPMQASSAGYDSYAKAAKKRTKW